MAHFLCHLGCSHFGALLLDFYFTENTSVELIEEIQGTNAHYEGDNDLTKCILKLPARYREMILLRYHHGYTVREIAKVLGLSLPTAIKLDQRAKSRLKKMCEEEGIL